MIKLIRDLARCRPNDIRLLLEASALLLGFRFALALVSANRIIRFTTRGSRKDKPHQEHSSTEIEDVDRVVWAIRKIAQVSPLEFVCFPQSLAGYYMLQRREVPSSIIYGVGRKDENLIAHTWLACGERTVLGGEDSDEFSPLAKWP